MRGYHDRGSGRFALWMIGALVAAAADAGPFDDGGPAPDAGDDGGDGDVPEQPEYGSRLVAVADVHGDLEATRTALEIAGVMDEQDRWVGGNTILVQTGDVLDRGPDERAILDLMLDLRAQAAEHGGAVHLLVGNHEIITAAGEYEYVDDGSCDAFADLEGLDLDQPELDGLSDACRARGAAFLPGGPYALLLAEWPVSIVVGDSVLVHGGIFPAHVADGLDEINDGVAAWLRGEIDEPPGAVGYTSNSMVWMRTFSEGEVVEAACEILESVLEELGVERMIVGHTIQEAINSECDGAVWRIDTGMSGYYGGSTEVLEILDGEIAVLADLK